MNRIFAQAEERAPGIEAPVLYWAPGNCSRVTMIALEETEIPFTWTYAGRDWATNPDYLVLNPKGKVPLLLIDGLSLTETPAILVYLTRRFPSAALLPQTDAGVEVDALSMVSWFAAGVHPLIYRFRLPEKVTDLPRTAPRTRELARFELERAFTILEQRLLDAEWLYGAWSIVDAYMLWLWFRATGSGLNPAQFPRCSDHAQRCESRPTVARVLIREECEYHRLIEDGGIAATSLPHPIGRARR